MSDPIEKTTRYATTVDALPEAWLFIMDRINDLGPDPMIEIKPYRVISAADMHEGLNGAPDQEWPRRFGVVVSGMVQVEETTSQLKEKP